MALGPRLDLRQSQSLVMTPQMQQAIQLLTLSNLEIEAFVGEALENNPLLEAGEVSREAGDPGDIDLPSAEPEAGGADGEAALDIAKEALDPEPDTGEWGSALGTMSDADLPGIEERGTDGPTLVEHLESQLGTVARDDREAFVARYLIGLLDEAGYLTADIRHVAGDLQIPQAEAERALTLVQSLEPTGVGARDLSECLALQAREADRYDPCMARMIDNLDLLARGDFARLKRMCDVDDEDFADMLAELRGYDPKPGLRYGGASEPTVVPDILITSGTQGEWRIALNEATLPRIVVNRDYLVELEAGCSDKASQGWLNEKLADANWLLRALDQRQKTILKTASEIVKRQDGFFRRGVADLRPLTLREVAEAIEMHESTVSRVTSNKYLHCERGTFELKYFFTSGVAKADGEGASSHAVKARIKALTDAEDPKKILSDDKLVAILKDEGFDIARRTVAKYREAQGIGSSVERRRAKKLAGIR
ncbi:RNA polymerase factor sigma-54 [Qipengyuania sp. JC766]|uniref:RNA polymerase factor sigma-54 n=1 Tax=Qipengyuania sp. JC766 TaxID=3232139 RepID=UPI003457B798